MSKCLEWLRKLMRQNSHGNIFSCFLAKAMQIGILYLTDESRVILNPAC